MSSGIVTPINADLEIELFLSYETTAQPEKARDEALEEKQKVTEDLQCTPL